MPNDDESQDLTLYTHPMSRGRIARWMLEEVGQPYGVEMLEYGTSMKDAAFLAVNPMGKVPVLRHGTTIVTETPAVCAYLADAFPQAGLAPPPAHPARGPYYRWLFFAAGPLEAAATNKAFGFVVPAERKGTVGYGSMGDVLDTIEAAVSGGGWLTGDGFTAADLVLGAQIGWGMMFGTIEKRPAFEAYWQRLSSRPAAVRACDIDDAFLPPERRMGARR